MLKCFSIVTVHFIFIVTSLVLLTECGKENNQNIELPDKIFPLTINKERELKFDIISRGCPLFSRIDRQNEDAIYLFFDTPEEEKIVKMNPNMEIKENYSIPEGFGPGEIQNPRIYGGDYKSIMVYDLVGFKYIEYSTNFKYVNEYKTQDYNEFYNCGYNYIPKIRTILDARTTLFRVDRLHLDFKIQIYSRSLNYSSITKSRILSEFDYKGKDENNQHIYGKPIHFGYFFDHIYILDKREYRLIKMDINGKILRNIKIKFIPVSFSKSEREKWLFQFDPKEKIRKRAIFPDKLWPAAWLMPIGNGIAIGRCKNYDTTKTEDICADYFDQDLNYLGRITIPYFPLWNHPTYGQQIAENCYLNFPKSKKFFSTETRIERGEDDEEYWLIRWKIGIRK